MMMQRLSLEHPSYRWVALFMGAVAIARVALTIPVFNQTIDEPYHIGAAAVLTQRGKHLLGVQHPPLGRLPAGVALAALGARVPYDDASRNVGKEDEAYAVGTAALFHAGVGYWKVLTATRAAMLLFPALALFYLYRLARMLTNGLVAMLGVAFFSLDPVLLGNGMWVTTDVPACAGYLIGIYHGLRWLERPTVKSATFAGLAYAVALGLKFSTLIIPGVLLLILVARPGRARLIPIASWIGQALVYATVAFAALWAIYFFDVGRMRESTVLGDAPQWQRVPTWVKETPVPMPSCWLGVMRLIGHNQQGHSGTFLGQFSQFGWWYFFPFIILMKTPLGFVAALLSALVVWLTRAQRTAWPVAPILLPAGAFLGVAMIGNLSLGVRHVLPILPFLYLFAVWQLVRIRLVPALLVMMCVAAVETAVIHPDYLAFFNVASGGPARAERITLDSDLDWGQDVYRLAQYLRSPEVAGREYTLRLSGRRQEPLVAALGLDPAKLTAPPRGLYAVNKRYRLMEADHAWLDPRKHVKRIGYSIDVYDLDAARD